MPEFAFGSAGRNAASSFQIPSDIPLFGVSDRYEVRRFFCEEHQYGTVGVSLCSPTPGEETLQNCQNASMLAVSYQIDSGLLDTFPSATREIRVLDLDERTLYKIIAFMK
ncbi:hypothetical protein OUZ56_016712 [Daphnia magna]|uniref:Uncharacterized protein n=1 Tax=Daphnia magna TaxID=35525 RepID=A0ABR0ARF1_9CRUS|nr:hypothetical protein OUZ56_016712 [Daphnia magna]